MILRVFTYGNYHSVYRHLPCKSGENSLLISHIFSSFVSTFVQCVFPLKGEVPTGKGVKGWVIHKISIKNNHA